MHDTVSNRQGMDAKLVPQPFTGDGHCRCNVRDGLERIGTVGNRIDARASRLQSRTATDAVDLALDLPPQRALALDRKDLEFDTGGTGIDDEDRIHGSHAATFGACWRRAWAKSAAIAHDAIRARAESARDVRTTGTLAPSPMPAPSALAK